MKHQLGGIIVPSLTVFMQNEAIDIAATKKHASWLVNNGVDAIVPCGSSGEGIALTLDEHKQIVEAVIDEVANDVPVYPATGKYSTKHTIELSQHAEAVGAKGVMVVTPYYLCPNREAVLDHFRKLRDKISIKIILYNNPWVTGYELSAYEISTLAREGCIDAVKASNGDPAKIHALQFTCNDTIKLLYGHDYAPMEAILCGADGWLSGIVNVFPKLCKALWQAASIEKNVNEAQKLWTKLAPFVYFSLNEAPHLISAYKAALIAQNRKVGNPRLPLAPLPEKHFEFLQKMVTNMAEDLTAYPV